MYKATVSIPQTAFISDDEMKKLVLNYLGKIFKLPSGEILSINNKNEIYYTQSCYHNDTENVIVAKSSDMLKSVIEVMNHIHKTVV